MEEVSWIHLHNYRYICGTALILLRYVSATCQSSNWPDMIMFSSVPGPANWPRRLPPENILLPEVGSFSETRTSTFWIRFAPIELLDNSTLWTVTEVPKSRAIHGAASRFVWQRAHLPPAVLSEPLTPSIQLPAPNWRASFWNVEDWVAVAGCSAHPVNQIKQQLLKVGLSWIRWGLSQMTTLSVKTFSLQSRSTDEKIFAEHGSLNTRKEGSIAGKRETQWSVC